MATSKQYDQARAAFDAYAKADKKYHDLHTAAASGSHFQKTMDNWSEVEQFALRLSREGKPWKDEVKKYNNGLSFSLDDKMLAAVDAYVEADQASLALASAQKALGDPPQFAEYLQRTIRGLNRQKPEGQVASTKEVSVKSGNFEGKTVSYDEDLNAGRAIAEKYEKAKAEEAKEDLRKKLFDKFGVKAKQEGLDSHLKETIAKVSKGAIIKIEGTSKSHEPARVEVANALEKYFNGLGVEAQDKMRKALGLDVAAGQPLTLTEDAGEKIVDRKLLGKALRLYQEQKGLVTDGKVGPATLEMLLAEDGIDSGINTAYTVGNVAQAHNPTANTPGHLGGKRNPYSLREYENGTETDPAKDQANQRARDAMLAAERVFAELQNAVRSVDGQVKKIAEGPASKVYTQKEHDALYALFVGEDGKEGPIDTTKTIDADQVKAFQKAFGLKADGVIGTETARALAQINLRLATKEVIDPSEIRAAAVSNAKPVAKAETHK